MNLLKSFLWLIVVLYSIPGYGQKKEKIIDLVVSTENNLPFENASVTLILIATGTQTEIGATDALGKFKFRAPSSGTFKFLVHATGYQVYTSKIYQKPVQNQTILIRIDPEAKKLSEVEVHANTALMETKDGKLILHVDPALSSMGGTVLDLLEKSPGVVLDKNGGLNLRGKSNVLVLIDDRPTYLSGEDLNAQLSSMSAEQVSQIELITNPSAKYDANGNAGIINIKTKKNAQSGFNGYLNSTFGWSRASKTNHTLLLNYRAGKLTFFANVIFSRMNSFTDIYARREYNTQLNTFPPNLEQNTAIAYLGNYQTLKTGLDFNASKTTSVGFSVGATRIKRDGSSDALASWEQSSGQVDSMINTTSNSLYRLNNLVLNLNLRQKLAKNQELSIDLDGLRYQTSNDQVFNNRLLAPGGYVQGTSTDIPATLKIFTGKVDYSFRLGKYDKLESGIKASSIHTNNAANYESYTGTTRSVDLTRSNQFLYQEYINAAYGSFEHKKGKINLQLGLRYENTHYKGNQLGNSLRPDSAFSKNYASFFPSANLSYETDSNNSFSLNGGRRIDRPAFQKLNPFLFIVNKYTLQTGNPYIAPQYTWNVELTHRYKQAVTTTIFYSQTRNYFSQLFLTGNQNTLIYTDGNVGRMRNIGSSVSFQFAPFKWWSFTDQVIFNYKELEGNQNIVYRSTVKQLQMSLNNQFQLSKTLSAELSGYYITKARNDLQELLYPTGQVAAGLSKTILKGNGSLKFSARDLFFTQAMEGLTSFPNAQEYFKLTRDSRSFTLGFSYRFGKPLKNLKRSVGGANDEINRAGN